jgi:succinate-semialdehyde dehydrogenase/glutarate-semialdehyde dehydrogenase
MIDGEWMTAASGTTFDVLKPANGHLVGRVPQMGAEETRAAIDAAHNAQRHWRGLTAKERADVLYEWYELVLEHADELARLLSTEQGKPLAEARGEIAYAGSFLRFYAEEARRVYGETIPAHRSDTRIVVLKEPIGVVGCITPWNFPSAMITRKAAPALAAGCTVVLKPAEATPFSAIAMAALAERAGVPAGVLNIVTGDPVEIGRELCTNPKVRKLSFTGSTRVGKLLAAACAGTVKKMALELGGNAPFIVFDDADLAAAVDGAVLAKFRHCGQTCVTANRFLVQAGVYDEFCRRLAERVSTLVLGDGLSQGVDIGPLINDAAVAKVQSHVDDAVSRGATVLTGGKLAERGRTFFQPTVVAGATKDMLFAQEETFGPVAAIIRFETEAEAIELANDTPYGLAAYFYTQDLARSFRVSEAIESGMVGINSSFLSVEIAPFGGIKESGVGREGSHHGLDEFLELKYLSIGGIRSAAL